jgi:hypothetical protein
VSAKSNRRAPVLLKAAAVFAGYAGVIWAVDALLVSRWVAARQLSLGVAFALVQYGAVALLLAVAFCSKAVKQVRAARSRRVQPEIRERLAQHAAGCGQTAALRRVASDAPRDFENCLIEALCFITGAGRERLALAAHELGIAGRWRKQAHGRGLERRRKALFRLGLVCRGSESALRKALADGEPLIRLEAARTLVRSLSPGDLGEVFAVAMELPLLLRAIVIEDLRPHAPRLSKQAIPEALGCGDPARVRAALEVLEAWGRALGVEHVRGALGHARPEIRAAALRLLPLAPPASEVEEEILRGFDDPEPRVAAAAAFAAGRLRLLPALARLARALESGDERLALAAAGALAEIQPAGWRVLERAVIQAGPPGAAAALECLERARIGTAACPAASG